MHLPRTNEGWSALATVVSAFAALLNLILIGFLARYTIRQTHLLSKQTEASATQTELLLRDDKQRTFRAMYLASVKMILLLQSVLEMMSSLHDNTLQNRNLGAIRPTDWATSAAVLLRLFPKIAPLPSQLEVDAIAVDATLRRFGSIEDEEERQKLKRELVDGLTKLLNTSKEIMKHLQSSGSPESEN